MDFLSFYLLTPIIILKERITKEICELHVRNQKGPKKADGVKFLHGAVHTYFYYYYYYLYSYWELGLVIWLSILRRMPIQTKTV